MQDVKMKKMRDGTEEEEEEEEMPDSSAAESEDDNQGSPFPNPEQSEPSNKFRPIIHQRLIMSSPQQATQAAVDAQDQANKQKAEETQPQFIVQQPSKGGGDVIEIRCVIERLEDSGEEGGGKERCVVLDAITPIPGSVSLRNLVKTVLNTHHFDSSDVLYATGSILPNDNWRAIKLDDVTFDPSVTVADIVSGFETSRLVLKITLPSCEQKLRETLLQFLLSIVSFDLFTKTKCPLNKAMLDQIRVGKKTFHLSKHKLSAFKRWVDDFKLGDQLENGINPFKRCQTIEESEAENVTFPRSSPSPKTSDLHATTSPTRSSTTTCDAMLEITKLNSWFQQNPNPSLTDLLMYVDKLNSQPGRRRSNPFTMNDVVGWFVDAKAKSTPLLPEEFLQSTILGTSSPNGVRKRQRRSSGCDSKSKETAVPSLPNRNAVYVVDPLLDESSDSESALVVQPTDDGDHQATDTIRTSPSRCPVVPSEDMFEKSCMKSDENHNVWSSPSLVVVDSAATDQATDLSLVKRDLQPPSTKSWNWKPVALPDSTGGRTIEQRPEKLDRREYDLSSGSSSPKTIIPDNNTLPAAFYPSYPLATMSGLPMHPNPFHAATMQILQQRALYNFSHPVFVPQSYDMENVGSPGSGNEENDRRKRSRVFIDPTTEIPRLEQWYVTDTHPSAQTIEQYTDELNKAEYRQRFPRLEPKNVQLWFKNHRAKMKRLRIEMVKCEAIGGSNGFLGH